jgi:tRNA-dihydrouridine synthase
MPVFVNGVLGMRSSCRRHWETRASFDGILAGRCALRLFCLIDDAERHLTAQSNYTRTFTDEYKSIIRLLNPTRSKKSKGLGGFGSKHKKEVAATKEKKAKEMKDAEDALTRNTRRLTNFR